MQINYTIINHNARIELGLTANEYMVADLIHNLSTNPQGSGWCYASKKRIGEMLGISDRSVHTILSTLLDKNLIKKHPDTKHLKTTPDWYNKVIIKSTEETSATMKKLHTSTEETSARDTEETSHNKDIYNKDNTKNTTNVVLKAYGNENINACCKYFVERMQIPREDCTQEQSRRYWNLLLKESKTGLEGVMWLIDCASMDTWYKHNITSSKDLYYKRVKIVSRKVGHIDKFAVMEGGKNASKPEEPLAIENSGGNTLSNPETEGLLPVSTNSG